MSKQRYYPIAETVLAIAGLLALIALLDYFKIIHLTH